MLSIANLLDSLHPFVVDVVPVLKIVFVALMGVGALAIIVLVLMQPSNSGGGANAITGVTETYYSQNKGKTREGRLKRWTAGIAITMALMTILYFVLCHVIPANI